jgi:diguanylate cyclase (GGDEF)-like protein/PAS domain S-box-containing protein
MTEDARSRRTPLRMLFSILVLLALVAYVLSAGGNWREARHDLEATLTHENRLLAQAVRATMVTHAVMLNAVGESLLRLGVLEQPERGRAFIEAMQRADPGMAGFGFARPDGQLLLISGIPAGRPLPSLMAIPESRDGFAAVLGAHSMQAGRPYFMKQLGQWVIPIRQPFHDAAGKPLAVMNAGYRIEGGTAAWARLTTGPDVTVLLLRTDGYRQYQHPLPGMLSDALLERLYGKPVDASLIEGLRRQPRDEGVAELEFDGGRVLAAYSRLKEHDLYAVTMRPAASVWHAGAAAVFAPTLWLLGYLLAAYAIYHHARLRQAQDERALRGVTAVRQAILDGASYAIISTDLSGTIRTFNAAAESMLGYGAAEVIDKATPLLFHDPAELARCAAELSAELGETVRPGFEIFTRQLRHGKFSEREWTYLRKDGSRLPVLLSVSPVRGAAGEAAGYIGIASDISERKAAQDQLEHQAHHDALTGLANRVLLHREFPRVVGAAGGEGSPALLLMDLDRFKEINDTLGHHVGDIMLQHVATRLTAVVDATGGGLVCRLGGDEFALLLPGAAARESPEAVARQLLVALGQPFVVGSLNLEIGASIGIAFYPKDGADSHALLRSADVAMYLAKDTHSGIASYSADLDTNTPERLALMTDLHLAFSNDELLLHYQPKLDLASREVVGFEALVRWQHPRLGLLQPAAFVGLAEMGELIHPLTLRVIELALVERQRWRAAGRSYTVAVNISARNLLDADFVSHVARLVERYEVGAGELEFELIETALIHDPEGAVKILDEIAALGIHLSIDDFGTGYSSLSYLRRLPLDALKIDRMFVTSLVENAHDLIIVRSTIGLAQNLGLKVIAEGVEDAATLQRLTELGCDQVQGYFISRPMPAGKIAALPPRFDA